MVLLCKKDVGKRECKTIKCLCQDHANVVCHVALFFMTCGVLIAVKDTDLLLAEF